MESKQTLFVKKNFNSQSAGDMAASENCSEVKMDPVILNTLDRYLKRFTELNDIIEAKGKLIDYIRKAR